MEQLHHAEWVIWILALLAGYLAGSVSFARIVSRSFGKPGKVKRIDRDIPDMDLTLESDAVSATTVNLEKGPGLGCLTSILDMIKAVVPTFIFHHLYPDDYYFLGAAFLTMVGHNLPIYHCFKGGRGLSPLIGALLIIDWFGLLLSNIAAMVLAYLTGSILVMRWAWLGLLVIWFAAWQREPWYAMYMIASSTFFFFSMRKELKIGMQIAKERKSTQEEVSDFMLMGKFPGRFLDNYGLPALLKKLIKH